MNKHVAWTLAQSRQLVTIGRPRQIQTVPKVSLINQKLYLSVLLFIFSPLFPSTAKDVLGVWHEAGPVLSTPGGYTMHRPCLGLVVALAGFHYTGRITKRGDEKGQDMCQESYWEVSSRREKQEQGRLVRKGNTGGLEGWGHLEQTEKRKLAGQMVNHDLTLLVFLRLLA